MSLQRKRILIFCSVLAGVSLIAFLIIKLAQGYKPDFSTRSLLPTGLLVATSLPDGAQIFIDGKLKSATNTTISLFPDEYEVEIKKDGFSPWKKKLTIKKEFVTKAEAYLFSTYPDLKALTFTGASNPLLSPDGQKVIYAVATSSASKRGLWVLDLADRPLGLPRDPRQIIISPDGGGRDFTKAKYQWSPDSKQILVTLSTRLQNEHFLLDCDRLNSDTSLIDISPTLDFLLQRWQKETEVRFQAQLSKLPKELLNTLEEKVVDLQFSPDETKILYTATASALIPVGILPPLPAASTQPESREISPGKIYIYDLKEDKNFFIAEIPQPPNTLSWLPTSKHLFLVQKDKISIMEYDGTNKLDVYSGPFENSFAFSFPAGNRILILTSISKDTPPNLYAVTLR